MNRMPTGIVKKVVADTPEAIRIFYRGAGTVTSVTVDTAVDLELISSEGTKTYLFATYTTVGALVDAINADTDGLWQVLAKDSLRSNATASVFINGVISASLDEDNVSYYGVLTDTSAALSVAVAWRGQGYTSTYNRPDSRRTHLVQISYFATLGGAGLDKLKVYQRTETGAETALYSTTSVSATATTIGFGTGGFVSVTPGSELIIVLTDAVSVADSGLRLEVSVLVE